MSLETIHTDKYTIRHLDGGFEVRAAHYKAIADTVHATIDEMNLPGHLFVTVVGGDSIQTGPEPDECGFALYMSGIRHVAVAGVQPDEWNEPEHGEWVRELKLSTIHELVHYSQELDGTLEDSKENEKQTEARAIEILQAIEESATAVGIESASD